MYLKNSLMGSPIVAGRIASPGSQSPSSLPYDIPTSHGSGNGVGEKNRTRYITESSTSRGPVSKVMDMFRNRSQSVSTDDKRKVISNFIFHFNQLSVAALSFCVAIIKFLFISRKISQLWSLVTTTITVSFKAFF